MSDAGGTASEAMPELGGLAGGSAGRLLRRAREAQGLPIDALAASIKVSVRKLELLEADRFDELPDATFTRALAQTVCRTLKLDAVPVLALLPAARGHRIEQVSEGLNAPFRDRSSRLDALAWGSLAKAAWAPLLFLVLAAMLYYMPSGFMSSVTASVGGLLQSVKLPSLPSAGPAASAPSSATAEAAVPAEPVMPPAVEAPSATAPPPPPAAGASTAVAQAPTAAGPLELRANAESWIEVKDARDRVLLSRSLQPGEILTLDGALPMRVKIGNASVTEVRFRGEPVDIVPMTFENIAKLELK